MQVAAPPGRSPALELDERCPRRISLDSVVVVTFSSTSGELFLPSLSIWRQIFKLCAWRLMHSHNFTFQVASRIYPLDPCCMPEDEGDLSLWVFYETKKQNQNKIPWIAPAQGYYPSPSSLKLAKVLLLRVMFWDW